MGLYTSALIDVLQIMKANGFMHKSLCMMGKQSLVVDEDNIIEILGRMNLEPRDLEWKYQIKQSVKNDDSFRFFALYGLEVHAIDYSGYEGADIICNLNENIPNELVDRFDYVIDGGVTEHIFDPARAISNMAKLVKPGGVIIHILPSVGYIDHGFYSFSPAFFTEFYHYNGFDIENLFLDFVTANGSWNIENYKEHLAIHSIDLRIFTNKEGDWCKQRLNEYVKMIYGLESVGHGHIWCVARKRVDIDVTYPIQSDYCKLYDQFTISRTDEKR